MLPLTLLLFALKHQLHEEGKPFTAAERCSVAQTFPAPFYMRTL
jgi:hypothetical protein